MVAASIIWMLLVVVQSAADETPSLEGRTGLAAGRPVLFSPAPNYELTARDGTDSADLTDVKLSQRANRGIWFESASVGWSYAGRVSVAVDLGQAARIDEVAIRLLGGSPQAQINFPGWIEAFVSDDGEHFVKVAECSRWNDGDFARFGVPADEGKAWIHCLRFTDLRTRGRWVGLRMYGTGLTASDELYVFGERDGAAAKMAGGVPSDFTVSHPQMYFHKPRVVVATNVTGPVPIGIAMPANRKAEAMELLLELPPGLDLLGNASSNEITQPQNAPGSARQYRFSLSPATSARDVVRLHLKASEWKDGQDGALRYRSAADQWQSPWMEMPVRAVKVPPAPRLKRIMAGLGWWSAAYSARWPDVLASWKHLGFNTSPVFPAWMKDEDPDWELVNRARQQGFFIAAIDSPIHRMTERYRNRSEVFHQSADAAASGQLCLSYRGPLYQAEVQRLAEGMARVRPDIAAFDIECFGQARLGCPKCSRCQADFKASGLATWDDWYVAKGNEMWRDLVGAANEKVQRAGGNRFEVGGYDFRPGSAYQSVWSVDQLYPQWIQSSQVSTYACLYPYHLALIGDEVRKDRSGLPRSDVLPWITPGNAGTFPGECFQWALLECYANGARGVWFWSSRGWDMESMIAYSRVIRALTSVEDILLQGELIGDAAAVEGQGRISGIRRGSEMVLLAADYARQTGGRLSLRLRLPVPSQIQDLLTGKTLFFDLPAGEQKLQLPLDGERGRFVVVRPM